jgi:hypothetical protein
MEDGSIQTAIGPWSDHSGAMNKFFTPSAEVSITDSLKDYQRGHTIYAAAMTVAKIQEALDKFVPDVEIIPVKTYSEIWYQLSLKNNPCQHTQGFNANGRCVECKHKLYLNNED